MWDLYKYNYKPQIKDKKNINNDYSRLNWLGEHYTKTLSILGNRFFYGYLIQVAKVYCYFKIWDIQQILTWWKNSSLIRANSLVDIVCVDNPKSKYGRFCLTYVFWSYTYSARLCLKTFINSFTPAFSSCNIYPSSGWLEREVWDMFGVKFLMHSDLRRILTDYGFQGHPLRKDFPLIGFLEVRYDDSYRSLVFDPVELTQAYRYFKFETPWQQII